MEAAQHFRILQECLGEQRFKALDDALSEYIVSILQGAIDSNTLDLENEVCESVSPLLIDAEVCNDECDANDVCRLLIDGYLHQNSGENSNAISNQTSKGKACENITKSISNIRLGDTHLLASTVSLPDDEANLMFHAKSRGNELTSFRNVTFKTAKDERKLELKMQKAEMKKREEMMRSSEESAINSTTDRSTFERKKNSQGVVGNGDIRLENITITVAGKELLADASITFANGHKFGLIGQNGSGKTTFLRHIAGHELEGIPSCISILHVEQEVDADERSVLDVVLSANLELKELLEEERKYALKNDSNAKANSLHLDEDSNKMADVYRRLGEIDSDGLRAKASMILSGLGFQAGDESKATNTFSGGWRMRVALAQALFVEPDFLLLDEPTNHLDLHSVFWLERYLQSWKGTILIVSHSREFLNSVVTDIVHLHSKTLILYKSSNYDSFEETRLEKMRNAQKKFDRDEMRRKHVQKFIDRFRYNANRAAIVQSRIKMLQKMAETQLLESNAEYRFDFPDPGAKLNAPIISLSNVLFGYSPEKILFHDLDIGIDMDSRIAIVGNNGAGKTTLLKLIKGELDPLQGFITISPHVRIATFSQHHIESLSLTSTALECMLSSFPALEQMQQHVEKLRSHLSAFGIDASLSQKSIYSLSGGQKSRVALAKITFSKPHILLLDEPSNHLDLEAVDALIQGLLKFEGGILMVSHDEYLISNVADDILIVQAGKATPFKGTFLEYKRSLKPKI